MRFAAGILLLTCLAAAPTTTLAQERTVPVTGDAFVEALAAGLELDWSPCPEKLLDLEGDVRCGVIGAGDPFQVAEGLALLTASHGGRILDVQFADGLPLHRYARFPGFEPIASVTGFRRTAYLIGEQRVSIWSGVIGVTGDPAIAEHWVALRVDEMTGPFPDYIPAIQRSGR